MKTSQAERVYWNALERLITNTAKIVDTKSSRFKITKDAVGKVSYAEETVQVNLVN